jgi:EF-P beta-lysylation protein EpmB
MAIYKLASHKLAKFEAVGWQQSLREAIRTPSELLSILELDAAAVDGFEPTAKEFSFLVPRSFAARMRKGDPQDPLLLQVLPELRERIEVVGFNRDPLRETRLAQHGVLKKYSGRALIVTTGACPIHCRYCFRRHFPYSDQIASKDYWGGALKTLQETKDVTEVILSGGDPLSLIDRRLAELVDEIEKLGFVNTLRLHTRFPIVLPERVGKKLLSILSKTKLSTVLVVHCNHANEIDDSVRTALKDLKSTGTQLLNQSVLLNGINDDADRLERLSRVLFDCGVLPYYLHLLDPVAGTAHFEVEERRAQELVTQLQHRLPGYLVPRLVREEPGELSKTIVT